MARWSRCCGPTSRRRRWFTLFQPAGLWRELCQPSLDGRGGPIAPIAIQATTFGLKNDMIQQVQNSCPFCGPGDDANKHLDKFLHVTQSMKVNGVSDDALRLISSISPCKIVQPNWFWIVCQRISIKLFMTKWQKPFLGKYFPPSMGPSSRNDISNFRQRPDESIIRCLANIIIAFN
ncbi:hypothetical protein Tco_1272438 [Tanacetum coccineum]